MGSANGNRPLLVNELRVIDATDSNQSGNLSSAESAGTPIERLVHRLRFENQQAAIAYLKANPGILGASKLMSSLDDQLQ